MLSFPNAKINIGLNVISKREDGFHDIESLLYPIPWRDVLEIIKSDKFKFSISGLTIETEGKDNLCVRAYDLLKQDFDLSPVEIHLHKVIPMGAGLGGGSSDAAHTLRILNHLFELNLLSDQLQSYAAKLGSDCPFFIDNIPALAIETGTILTSFPVSLSGYYLAVIYPGVHVGTKEAYAGILPEHPELSLSEKLNLPVPEWKDQIENDFEKSVFKKYPIIGEIKQEILDKGAVYAAMSGSGSAVYGLFDENPGLDFHHLVFIAQIKS